MKILLMVTLILLNSIFAYEQSSNDNNGKIDMHGGKSESLINQKNSLSNKGINNLGIVKPIAPSIPETLIKEEKNDKKETKK